MITIEQERPDAGPRREALLDRAFGMKRFAKTAEMLRHRRQPAPGLSFVALDGEKLIGTLRFWHVQTGCGRDALLLGPLAVVASHRGRSIGAALIRHGLREAERLAHRAVLLVGDESYYRRFGFRSELTRGLRLPGPVDPRRFLGLELAGGALHGTAGVVRAHGLLDPAYALQAA